MVPAGNANDFNASLPDVDSSGNSLVWYVKVLSDPKKSCGNR